MAAGCILLAPDDLGLLYRLAALILAPDITFSPPALPLLTFSSLVLAAEEISA